MKRRMGGRPRDRAAGARPAGAGAGAGERLVERAQAGERDATSRPTAIAAMTAAMPEDCASDEDLRGCPCGARISAASWIPKTASSRPAQASQPRCAARSSLAGGGGRRTRRRDTASRESRERRSGRGIPRYRCPAALRAAPVARRSSAGRRAGGGTMPPSASTAALRMPKVCASRRTQAILLRTTGSRRSLRGNLSPGGAPPRRGG